MKPLQNLRRLGWLFVLWFIVVALGMLGWFVETYRPAPPSAIEEVAPTPIPTPTLKISEESTPPFYSAKEVWIFERNTGSLLYVDNSEEATAVASLAKLMTALVAYESYDLQDVLPIGSASAVIGNKAKFYARDRFTVADLLRAMLVFSANDAAQAIANGFGGNGAQFVERMNEKAQELGLEQTHFVNSFGMDDPDQFSTAADIGRLAHAVLAVPFLEDVVSQEQVLVHERATGRTDTIYSTNVLLRQGPQYRGVKTGTTELAGESLVLRYVDDSETLPRKLDLLVVILGSEDRYAEAKSLVKWVISAIQPNIGTVKAFSAP